MSTMSRKDTKDPDCCRTLITDEFRLVRLVRLGACYVPTDRPTDSHPVIRDQQSSEGSRRPTNSIRCLQTDPHILQKRYS